ncbi:MAG: hypothetical protein B6245_11045 [Desulfobacteraceae bacterium 4572_88]|nr:MAG: hypothetical protein B6245_11045 [Desulfobacteraceae bacterium 4572_88]
MSGIVFLKKRHIRTTSLTRAVLREIMDAFEAVGIWFLTVLCLVVMGATVWLVTLNTPIIYYLLLTYATALSLIIAAPVHSMLTRHLLDEIFLGNLQSIINGMIAASTLVVVVATGFSSLIVFWMSRIPLQQKISFISLSTLLSLFWCIGSVLSSLRKERIFFFLFVTGMTLTLTLFFVFRPVKVEPLMLIFSLGITIPVAGGYGYVVRLYLREKTRMDQIFLKRSESFKIGISLFTFYLGFWMDKFIFWFSPKTGQAVDPLFHYYVEYDYPFFVATIIMMVGSVMVYKGIKRKIIAPYEAFIFKLSNNFPFRELAIEKKRLFHGIGQVSQSVLIIYGGISVYILFLLYIRIIPPPWLPWKNPFVFYYLLLGTIFFSLYFFYFLVIQYLDDYNSLLKLNILFLTLNVSGSLISLYLGDKYYGIGFMTASMISALAAFVMVNSKVGGLEFEVFKKALQQKS